MKLDVGQTVTALLHEHAGTVLVSIPAEKGTLVPPKQSAPSKITGHNVLAVLVSREMGTLNVSQVRKTSFYHFIHSSTNSLFPVKVGECSFDYECQNEKACIENYCQDPCRIPSSPCGEKAQCLVKIHRAVCQCPPEWAGNPHQECFQCKWQNFFFIDVLRFKI